MTKYLLASKLPPKPRCLETADLATIRGGTAKSAEPIEEVVVTKATRYETA